MVENNDPVDYVNPYIGTGLSSHFTAWSTHGGTFPGVLVPYGMVQITPDGYFYSDEKIKSFSFLNHRSGWSSGGSFQVMPSTGDVSSPLINSGSAFNHENEKTTPYHYSVLLEDYEIKAEFTATARAGFGNFTYPQSAKSNILLSDLSDLRIIGNDKITGRSRRHYFTVVFSKPFELCSTAENGENFIQADAGRDINSLFVRFSTSENEVIKVKMGFSLTSMEGAESNLKNEIPAWDFEQAKLDARKIWNDKLSQIEIKGGSEEQKELFYTSLYHSFFIPTVINDFGSESIRYSSIYPWDTYRCKQPLFTILDPGPTNDMILSLLDRYDRTGWLPTGNMLANHNIAVILDSYVKGISDFDIEKAYEAMRKSIMEPPYARRDFTPYVEYGYVPATQEDNVTKTLEYAYNDWALTEFIRKTDRVEELAADYKILSDRAYSYENLFNPAVRFMRAKTADGNWSEGGYCEGTEWTYSWYVPHDVQGLINLMGGRREFSDKLELCFAEDYYVHDNEGPLHYAYLFNYAGEPWRTQKWARDIMDKDYSTDPGGLPGNDDLGTLSSWYVLSSMGIYPVSPGKPYYEIGSPIFDEVLIHVGEDKSFSIVADNVSKENKYIQSASLDGNPLNRPWLDHKDIMAGGTLVFQMGPEPNKEWGNDLNEAAPSMTQGSPYFIVSELKLSSDKIKADEPLKVCALVENKGNAGGTVELRIKVDNEVAKSEWIIVDKGKKENYTTELKFYEAEKHEITINSLEPQSVQVVEVKPTFIFSDLKMPYIPLVFTGDTFNISATVKNIGSTAGSTLATLNMNERNLDSKEIVLGPGEEKMVEFITSYPEEGLFPVSIADLKPERLHIIGKDSPEFNNFSSSKSLKPLFIYNFDEGPGQMVEDLSGSGNNAIVHGDVKWVDGLFGKAVQTNAPEGSYIEVPHNPDPEGKTYFTELTMMLWVYPMEEVGFADILTNDDLNVIQVKAGNTVVNVYSGGAADRQAYAQVPENWNRNWHHVAAVLHGKYQKLYLDGKLAGIKEIEPHSPLGESRFRDYPYIPWNIGRNGSSTNRIFKGFVDDVRVYSKALSSEDISNIMLYLNE